MRKFKLGVLALGAALAVGVGAGIALRSNKAVSVSAEDEVYYTLTPATGTNNSYAGNCDVTIGGIKWNITGNSQQLPWRLGGKNLTNVDRAVYSKTAMGSEITKIDLTVGTANNITVNSLTLKVASDASFGTLLDTVTATFKASSTITFAPTSGTNWAKDAYYKFIFNVSVSGSSNKFVEFSEAKFYSVPASNPEITLSDNDLTLINGVAKQVTISPNSVFSATPTVSVEGTPSYTNVAVNGLTLTLTPKAVGNEAITIKAVNGEQVATATLNYEVISSHGRVADDPFTVAEAKTAIDNNDHLDVKVYVAGIVSQVDTPSSFSGSLCYWISDDGTTTNQFEIYWGKDVGNVNFPSADAVEVGATVVNYGTVKKYNSTYEFDSGSYLISYTAPVSTKVLQSIALSGEYPTEFYQGYDFSHEGMVVTATYDDESTKDVTSQATFTGYDMSTLGQQTVTVSYTENEVTKTTTYNINVVEYVADTYLLVENVSDLSVGDKVIIAAANADVAMSTTQNTNNRGQAEVVKSTTDNTLIPTDKVQVFTLVEGNVADSYGFYTGSGYIYAASSSSNYLKTETELSNNSSFKIEFDSPKATMTAQGSNTRKVMQYNASSKLFSCYASASQGALSLYKKVEATPSAAEVFAEKILSETQSVCAAYVDKVTDYATQKAALEDIWTTLSSEFTLAALDETELAKLVSAEGKEDGTTIEQAMYRYDFLTAKYGLTNFITGRVVAQAFVGINPAANNANVNMLAIIIIASVALVTTTGAITAIIIKKRVSR